MVFDLILESENNKKKALVFVTDFLQPRVLLGGDWEH